jgi:hypothetical protein
MKPTKFGMLAIAAAVVLGTAYSVQAVPVTFPLVQMNISGIVSYNADNPSTNGTAVKSELTKVSITTKSLISLLNSSTNVTKTLLDVTGTNQIPSGSYFVYDLYNENLIVTNKNGFRFTLKGEDAVTSTSYEYGYLDIDMDNLIGSFNQNDNTGVGNETDLTGIDFYFYDKNGNQLEDYGNGFIKWNFGKVSGSVQKTTLSIDFPASNGYNDEVNYNSAIAQNVRCSGSATGNVYADIFPFYLWW